MPVAFGVVTTETPEQAFARAGGTAGNKGFEAVETALDTAAALAAVSAQALEKALPEREPTPRAPCLERRSEVGAFKAPCGPCRP